MVVTGDAHTSQSHRFGFVHALAGVLDLEANLVVQLLDVKLVLTEQISRVDVVVEPSQS